MDGETSLRDQLTRSSFDSPRRVGLLLGLLVVCLGAVALFGLTRGAGTPESDVDPAYLAVLDELDRMQARLMDYQRDIGTLDAGFADSDDQDADRDAYEAGLVLAAESLRLNVSDSAPRLAAIETSPGTPAERAAALASTPFERAADWAAAYPAAVRTGDRSRLDEIDMGIAAATSELCAALRAEDGDEFTKPRVDALCGEF